VTETTNISAMAQALTKFVLELCGNDLYLAQAILHLSHDRMAMVNRVRAINLMNKEEE
jgi:hypothetical protein